MGTPLQLGREACTARLEPTKSILKRTIPELVVSKYRLRQSEGISLIRNNREVGTQRLAFSSRPFVLCGLPYRRPPVGQLLFERRNGQFLLQLTGHPDFGLPFGQDRLVPILLATMAVQQKSQIIRFRSGAEMLDTFGMAKGGKEYRRLVAAFERICSGHGVRLIPENEHIRFEIAERDADHSPGTVKDGNGSCPFPDCHRTIDGDEIKAQAKNRRMGHQLYCVVYNEERVKGYAKNGKPKTEKIRGFRAPQEADNVEALIERKFEDKMPLWQARNIVPDEEIDALSNYERGHRMYGMFLWRELFSRRQLYGHCISVEIFQQLLEECVETDLDRAAMVYVALAIDKFINYNSEASRWDSVRVGIRGKFDQHNFNMQWSYGEMAPVITGNGYDWVLGQTGKALVELIELLGQSSDGKLEFSDSHPKPPIHITCASADILPLTDASVE